MRFESLGVRFEGSDSLRPQSLWHHCGHAVDPDEIDLYVHVVEQVSAEDL
jgi:hypothetical protein